MNIYEYTGVVEFIGETKAFGANGFTKRDFVVGNDVDTMSYYPNPVLFTFKRERCTLCDAVKVGDRVKVQFTVEGRRWDSPQGVRYFVDLTAWKVEILNADGSSMTPTVAPTMASTVTPPPPPPPVVPSIDAGAAIAGDPENLPF